MIDFEEARQIVAAARSSRWPAEANYQVATWGLENATDYQLHDGPYVVLYEPKSIEVTKWLQPNDGEWVTVNKTTGELTVHQGPDENGVPFELPGATPVGTGP